MSAILRQLLFLGLSALLTWWVVLRGPSDSPVPDDRPLRVAVEAPEPSPDPLPPVSNPPEEAPVEAPVETEPEPVASESLPPPPERGAPEGGDEGRGLSEEAVAAAGEEGAQDSAEVAESSPSEAALDGQVPVGLMDPDAFAADAELLERARAELAGTARQGFATELLASSADQLDIARAFGETLVLVPWAAIDAEDDPADYFRLVLEGEPRVERVRGPFDPGRFRFHRDLFDYEYADLPTPLRSLRRSVVPRDDVYLFAALIPAAEWAVVVGRRDEALARLDLAIEDVRSFRLRYLRLADGRFDLRVEQVVLADGRRRELEP